ncbi:MAG: hypothetical protein DMG49_20230 [Acidobacteria bacterium]|nr:MAG: hypothetical protein DMG49_20230 [Acidobacteriota bacterium]
MHPGHPRGCPVFFGLSRICMRLEA